MKRTVLIFVGMLLIPIIAAAQFTYTVESFDALPDTNMGYDYYGNDDENFTYINPSLETSTVQVGSGALRLDWQNERYDLWGGWIGLQYWADSVSVMDEMALYDTLTLWYYNESAQNPGDNEFRVILYDNGGPDTEWTPDHGQYEVWISHHYILDDAPGWHQLKMAMEDIGIQDGYGFWNPGWGQVPDGNGVLDVDAIMGWAFEWSQATTYPQDSTSVVQGVIIFDELMLSGVKKVDLTFFNGKNVPGNVNMHIGWSGVVEVTDEEYAPSSEGTNSIKWTDGAAWDAVNFTLAKPANMVMNWSTDSLQFKIKADAGIGDLTLNFWDVDHDPDGKDDYSFTASYALTEASVGYDGTWKEVKIALTDFNRFAGVWDGDLGQSVPGEFDSTEVAVFSIGNMGQAIASPVYFDDVWTGNPEFDFTPPDEVAGVTAVAGDYYNLVFWNEVPGETGETYTVYASTNEITDLDAPGVEIVVENQLEGIEGNTVTHWLQYPLSNSDLTYYYAVNCKDEAGNVGPTGNSSPVTNVGEAVPSIHFMPTFTFKADGDLSEWINAGVMPWEMDCTINNIAAGTFDNDPNDLSPTAYVAVDDQYLYVAVDVIDNSRVYDAGEIGAWWTQDAFEFFIGMWDQNGKGIHTAAPYDNRGAEPDYKLIFLEDGYHNEYKSWADPYTPELAPDPSGNGSYYYEVIDNDYVMEARIALDSIAYGDDVPLSPQNGMRIMFDLVFHDNDVDQGGNNNLTWSPNNRDLAYLDQFEWTNTWIGDTTHVDVSTSIGDDDGNLAGSYNLSQNYPNPFNPETTIEFAIAKAGDVEIQVYNLLGQNVFTVLNEKMNAGRHQVKFDGMTLSSGIYFYTIKSGDFFKTRKMLLLK